MSTTYEELVQQGLLGQARVDQSTGLIQSEGKLFNIEGTEEGLPSADRDAIQQMQAAGIVTPVSDGSDLAERKSGWRRAIDEFLADPDTPLTMFQVAAALATPLQPGETPILRIAQALGQGVQTKMGLQDRRAAQEATAQRGQLEQEEVALRGRQVAVQEHAAATEAGRERRLAADQGEFEKTRQALYRQVLQESGLPDTPENRNRVAKEVAGRLERFKAPSRPQPRFVSPEDPAYVEQQLAQAQEQLLPGQEFNRESERAKLESERARYIFARTPLAQRGYKLGRPVAGGFYTLVDPAGKEAVNSQGVPAKWRVP